MTAVPWSRAWLKTSSSARCSRQSGLPLCVTQIRFPVWSHGRIGVGFHEVSTRRSDFALVSAAAQVALNDEGRCVDVAVGVGGAGDRPVRLEVSSLRLSALDPAAISMAVTTAVADLEVSHDRYVSAAYRRRAADVHAEAR